MIFSDNENCPKCSGELLHYDTLKRSVRTKYGKKYYIFIERRKCSKCGSYHRLIPNIIIPYKRYEAEIITGVVEGLIDSDTLGFEDYPCDRTMEMWRSTRFLFTD